VSADSYTGKNPVMVEAEKKAALTRQTGVYTVEQHMEKIEEAKRNIPAMLQEYILSLDESVEEVPKKLYIAYKISQNFVCMEVTRNKVLLYLKLDPQELPVMPVNGRDVTNIGH